MSNDIPYTGPRMADSALITRDEVDSGKAAAPEGTSAYTVQPGDNLSTIATQHGYGSPPDMDKFRADNPQYDGRDINLIYPGEQVFVSAPENGTTATRKTDPTTNDPLYQNYKDGKPQGEPYPASTAPNGRPADANTIDQDGNPVRTGAKGNAANGYFTVDGNSQDIVYQKFENGVEVPGDRFSVSAHAEKRQTDDNGALIDGTTKETRDLGRGEMAIVTKTYEKGVLTSTTQGRPFS